MTLALQLAIHPLLVLVVLPIGGWLAVYLYARGRFPITAGIGARLGAVTGCIGFAISLAFMGLKVLFNRGQFLAEMKKGIQAAAAQNPDPQAQQIMQRLMSPEGVALLITFAVVFLFFMFLVLCSVGGAIGGSIAKSKHAA